MRAWPGKRLLDETVILWVSYPQTWYLCCLQNNVTQAIFLFSALPKDLVLDRGSGFPRPWRRGRYVEVGVSEGRMVEGRMVAWSQGGPLGRCQVLKVGKTCLGLGVKFQLRSLCQSWK